MNNVKSSSEGRIISMETIGYDDLPKKAKIIFPYESYERIKKFSYNAGGELVNYGLNTFVRDVFVYFNGSAAIYSDRFGNYYKIKDKKIIKCLADSNKVTVTDEGILVFYRQGTDTNVYFTLNFKSGILTQLSALLNDTSKLNVKVYEIFSKYGKTFAQIQAADDKNNKENLFFYYLLDFSFNFYESYGSTIKIHTYDLSDKITVKEDITPDFKFDIESCKIYKNKTTLTLKRVEEKCQLTKFTSKFGDSYLENEKIMSVQYDSSNITYIYYDEGDIGISDTINSFVNSIRYCSALPVRRNFKLFEGYKVALIMRYDRFKHLDVYRVEEDIFYKIFDFSVHYVSLEGVIVTLYSNYYDSPKLFAYISLDGFIWRSYNLSHLLDEQYKYAKFTSNGSKNYITVYDTSDYSQNKKDYFVDFKFNFWDLYNSPVEMFFD